jgi:hypothetical protein
MGAVNILGALALDTTLQQVRDRLPADGLQHVEIISPALLRVGFAEVGAGLVGAADTKLDVDKTGTAMAVSQSAGNLVITTGTTANAETVIQSVDPVSGSFFLRAKTVLSQRIANQTFRVELADLIGDALAYSIVSTTLVDVTFPAGTCPFTSANVGQSMRLSQLSGVGIPGRFAIASVTGDVVRFTVVAWPASGSGTLTLYGWNAIWVEYSGTTATSASFDAARRGWASGPTAATINTTAAPGHVAQLLYDIHTVGLADALVASNAGYQWTGRASRIENLPDPEVPLYLWIVAQNGSTVPASTTTWTMGFVQIEDLGRQKVRIASSDPSSSHAQPVQVLGGNVAVSGSVTATVASTVANVGTSGATVYTDSATNLAISAIFTGTARDGGATPAFNLFVAHAFADQAGTVEIQKSTDNVTWRRSASAAVAAGAGVELVARCTARYYRVVYTNGGVAQTAFSLTSAYQRQ